ncbi:MAG: hypothetical protein QME64_06950, partial [bacterium]|nr:hypothetical protein [bacterium]
YLQIVADIIRYKRPMLPQSANCKTSPVKYFKILHKPLAKVILLFTITILVYIPALFAGFIWDDGAVTDNFLLRTTDGLWKIWFCPQANIYENHYWPIVYTFFWIEYHLWGNLAFGYHLVNILLHSLNAILLWYLLKK